MREDLQEALEAAASAGLRGSTFGPERAENVNRVRAKILEFLRGCPEDMSVRDLREGLEP
jgi:hypothetical protein